MLSHILSHMLPLCTFMYAFVCCLCRCAMGRRGHLEEWPLSCVQREWASLFARSVNSSKMLICHHAVKIRSPGIKSCFSPFSLPPFRNYLFLLPLRHYLLVDSFPTKGPYQATYPSDKPIHHRNILKMTSPSASIRSFRYDTPVVKGLTSLVPTSRGLKGEFSPLVR